MISVTFTSDVENIVATEHLYQWDNGQKLSISGVGTTADIHFANKKSEKALVVTPTITSGAMIAFIPNSLLAEHYPIIAYVYVPSDDGSKTIKSVTINVEARKQPSDFVLTEDEGVTTLEAISQRANEMIQNATNQVNSAIANMQTDYTNFKNTIHDELADMVANTTIPNADTVGGLPASSFLGSSTKFNYHFMNGNGELAISTVKEEDHRFAFNFTDTPTNYGFIDVSAFDGEGFTPVPFGLVRQVWTDWANPSERFVRIYKATSETDGVWTDWSRCNADTIDGLHTSDFALKTDIPTSLPANGGNATTAITLSDWSGSVVENADDAPLGLSKIGAGSPNNPFNFWAGLLTLGETSNPNYRQQLALAWSANDVLSALKYRVKDGATWTEWQKLNDGGNAATANTANTAGTLATTPTNVCLRNISFGTAKPQVTDSSAEGYVAPGALYAVYE